MPKPHIPIELGQTPLTDVRSLGGSDFFPRSGRAAGLVWQSFPSHCRSASRRAPRLSTPRSIPSTIAKACLLHPAKGAEAPAKSGERAACRSSPRPTGPSPKRPLATRSPTTCWRRFFPTPSPSLPRRISERYLALRRPARASFPAQVQVEVVEWEEAPAPALAARIGPGTQFFGARDHAHSFVYLIDCSGSMATHNSLDVAKREMLASINQLPPDAHFAVIFYNLQTRTLSDPLGRKGLMPATASNKARVQTQLEAVQPLGGTDHMFALRDALKLKPEVIFFLTDADLMTNGDVDEILTEVGPTRIQAVEFGLGMKLSQRTPLGRLATTTGGAYLYIDVNKFPRSADGF